MSAASIAAANTGYYIRALHLKKAERGTVLTHFGAPISFFRRYVGVYAGANARGNATFCFIECATFRVNTCAVWLIPESTVVHEYIEGVTDIAQAASAAKYTPLGYILSHGRWIDPTTEAGKAVIAQGKNPPDGLDKILKPGANAGGFYSRNSAVGASSGANTATIFPSALCGKLVAGAVVRAGPRKSSAGGGNGRQPKRRKTSNQ